MRVSMVLGFGFKPTRLRVHRDIYGRCLYLGSFTSVQVFHPEVYVRTLLLPLATQVTLIVHNIQISNNTF